MTENSVLAEVPVHNHLLPLFRNRDAIIGKISNSFSSHYLLGRDESGRNVLELQEDDAGIVMAKSDSHRGWLKTEFQSLAKEDAASELLARARRDFNVETNEELRRMRTVGCGTNVFLALSDGLYYAAVERTAPKKTDSGSVNAGAYSRAAGGAMGNVDLTALRELNEELFIVARMAGRETALHIIPEAYKIDPRQERGIAEERRERFEGILEAHGQGHIRLSNHFEMKTPCIIVPHLTEDVVERTVYGDKVLKNRVFGDSPAQMDVNGVDSITAVHLPYLSSKDIVAICDGEVNQKGELLKRKWALYPVDEIHDLLSKKEIVMSPVPGRVIGAKDDVVSAIQTTLGI